VHKVFSISIQRWQQSITSYSFVTSVLLGLLTAAVFSAFFIFLHCTTDLPDYKDLVTYDPPVVSRLYTQNGDIIAQYGNEHRIFVPYHEIPKVVVLAFLSAEDKDFFSHKGINFTGLMRALAHNILYWKTNRLMGGSTITQQIVKDFLVGNERSIMRKIREAVLAYRIDKALSKERILELYLNKIFLGNNSFGIVSAAQNYFGKSFKDLNLAEAAMLAALPKAPSTLNPFTHYEAALNRRNWVIGRMIHNEVIGREVGERYSEEPIILKHQPIASRFGENFYTEAVRQSLIEMYGDDVVYKDGLTVVINLDKPLQELAEKALRKGVETYDKKHGWRGPLGVVDIKNWNEELQKFVKPQCKHELATVLKINKTNAEIAFVNKHRGYIELAQLMWARKSLPEQRIGIEVRSPSDVLKAGDVILVSHYKEDKYYALEQIPEVNGAVVVMQAFTGKVLALVGGYNFDKSNFNRATQAKRQPGSAFKALVYLAAFENGFNLNDKVLDAPIALPQSGNKLWQPKNYTGNFLGEIPLVTALAKSVNTATVRLMLTIGPKTVLGVAKRLGVYDRLPNDLNYSMALGSLETTLLQLTNAYNIIAGGGYETQARLIDSIYDTDNKLIYFDEAVLCKNCDRWIHSDITPTREMLPSVLYEHERMVDGDVNALMTQALEEVIQSGTARSAKILGGRIMGKTGTTNESRDAWFIGSAMDLTVGVYIGFDTPKTLGKKETGGTVALPIFIDFMKNAVGKQLKRNIVANIDQIAPTPALLQMDDNMVGGARARRNGDDIEAVMSDVVSLENMKNLNDIWTNSDDNDEERN